MKKVVIIGAGPAGLSAAIELAKHRVKCLILEKGRPGQLDERGETKLCGGGLISVSQKFLGQLRSETFENRYFVAKTTHGRADVSLNYSPITTIDRDLLALELTERATRAGVEIKFNSPILEIDFDKRYIKTKDEKITYDFLIGADGVFSMVRRKLEEKGVIKNNHKFLQAVEYEIDRQKLARPLTVDFDYHLFSGGFAWIFPHKNFLYIGACESNLTRTKKKHPLINDLLIWLKKESLPYDKKTLRGWIIPYDYQGYKFDKDIFLIGDAAGFTGGFLGEGISYALLSGFDVANIIIDSHYDPKNIKKVLKTKKLHETFLALGNRIPFLRTIIIHLMVWLASKNLTKNIPLRLFNLQKE